MTEAGGHPARRREDDGHSRLQAGRRWNIPSALVRPETDGDTCTWVSPPPQPRLSLWSLISKAFVDIVRSVRIGRIFRVQNALNLIEMRDREIRDLFPVLRGPLGDVVGQHIEGLA